jgi:hypothetical protein
MADESTYTVDAVFANYIDADGVGRTAYRGEELDSSDLAEGEADRLERAGAFKSEGTDAVNAAFNNNPRQGGSNAIGAGATGDDEATGDGPTDKEIDALSGDELDQAVRDAGIDPDEGGSLSDGSMSADEKRAALKEAR